MLCRRTGDRRPKSGPESACAVEKHAVPSGCGGGVRLTSRRFLVRPMTPTGQSAVGGPCRLVPPTGIPESSETGHRPRRRSKCLRPVHIKQSGGLL